MTIAKTIKLLTPETRTPDDFMFEACELACDILRQHSRFQKTMRSKDGQKIMTIERALALLDPRTEWYMPDVPHTADEAAERDEACRLTCDILRQYNQHVKELAAHQRYYPDTEEAFSIDVPIAEHYKNIGLPMARLDELAKADKAGRVVILPEKHSAD